MVKKREETKLELVEDIEDPIKKDDKLIKEISELRSVFAEGNNLSKITGTVPSGSIVIDHIAEGGRNLAAGEVAGYPLGRQIVLEGLPGSGKSTGLGMCVAQVQGINGIVIGVDAEERVDYEYWAKLGVKVEDIIWIVGHNLEEIYTKLYKMLLKLQKMDPDRVVCIFWDGFGSASLKDIMEEESNEEDPMTVASKLMGKKARVNSAGLSLINPLIAKLKVVFIYTNQLYSKMNVKWGSPWESEGGNKAKYFATLRLRLSRVGQITEKDDNGKDRIIGHEVEVEAIKNSMSPYLLCKRAAIIGNKGFCNEYTVWLTCSEKGGPISRSGAWSTWVTSAGEEVKFSGFKGFNDKIVTHSQYQELVDYTKKNM